MEHPPRYHCEGCDWEGLEEDLGITSTDEGTHCWQCPSCLSNEISWSEIKEDNNGQ